MNYHYPLTFFLLLPSLFIASNASAGIAEIDGNALLDNCKEAVRYWENKNTPAVNFSAVNFCIGYMSGINDLHKTFVKSVASFEPPLFCTPPAIKIEELVKVVVKFLEAHQENLSFQGSELTIPALREAYPCH